MKKSIAIFATVLAAVLNAATPSTSLVYKNTTTNALTGNIVAGNNTTISATGNGTITATALNGNITGNPTISGNLTVSGTGDSSFAIDNAHFLALDSGNLRIRSNGYLSSQSNVGTILASNAYYSTNWSGTGTGTFLYLGVSGGAEQSKIYLGGTSSGTPTVKFTLDTSTGATTLAGNLTVSGTGTFSNTSASTPTIALNTTQTSTGLSFLSTIGGAPSSERNWAILTNAGAYGDFVIRSSNAQGGNPITAGTTALTIDNSNNATFAGNVTVGNSSVDSGYSLRFTKAVSGTFPRTDKIVFGSQEIANGSATILGVQTAATGATGYLQFNTTNSGTSAEKMRLTSTGILTLSTTTPPPWDPASFNVIAAGSNAFGGTNTGSNNLILASNTYFDGSVFKYATTGYATAYRQLVGEHYFYVAASGTAGNTTSLTTALTIKSGGTLQLNQYGAGTLTTDSSGNVTATSDERAKNITGTFTKGLAEVVKLTPKRYTWKPETGLNTTDEVASLTAQDLIAAGIPEAVSTYRTVADVNDDGTPKLDDDGKPVTKRLDATYTVSDRTVIAALVNAVKELKAEVDALKAARN